MDQQGIQVPVFAQLRDKIKDHVDKSKDSLLDKVSSVLAEKEIERRTVLLISVFEKRKEAERALNKIKPDSILFDANGVKVSEGFTKAGMESLKKAKEALAKIDKAIEKAVNEANFEEAMKVKDMKIDGGKPDQPSGNSEASSESAE